MRIALRSLLLAAALAACPSPTPSAPDAGGKPDTGWGCPAGRLPCSGRCVEALTDLNNCGACGRVCAEVEECIQGTCVAPDCRNTGCAAGHWCDAATGACRMGCTGTTGCGANQVCDEVAHTCVCRDGYKVCGAGQCVPAADACPAPTCATGRTLCDGQCVDLWTDPRHCSGCGKACQPGEVCKGTCQPGPDCRETPCTGLTWCDLASGICKPGCSGNAQCDASESCEVATHTCVCAKGKHRCGGVCVSDASPASCGTSCTPCLYDPHGRSTCTAGVCGTACLPGYHSCGATCASSTALDSCGTRCGSPCPTDPNGQATCDGTSCGLVCNAGFHLCGGRCVSNHAVESCGSSCGPCPTDANGTASCDGTSCALTCRSGYLKCNGACRACPGSAGSGTFACSGDACVATSCAAGNHLCGQSCVSNGSPASCGATSCTPCPGIANGQSTCDGTSCGLACNSGYRMCDGACAACPASGGIETTTCSAGACVVATCRSGYHLCGGACTSNTSTASCGTSCSPCPGTANGYSTCNGSACGLACNATYLMCGSACVQCPSGGGVLSTACAANACVAQACAASYHNCGAAGCCAAWTAEPLRSFGSYMGRGNTAVVGGTIWVTTCENYSTGTPHGGYLGKKSGGSWTWTKVIDNCQKLSVRADSTGGLHLAAEEFWSTTNASVYYGSWNGASVAWTKLDVGGKHQLALDSAGKPFVVYSAGNTIKLALQDNSTWTSETVTGSGMAPSLAFAPGDVPAVAYADTGSWATIIATRSGGWQYETLPAPTLQLNYVALMYGPTGAPAVAGFHSTDKVLYAGRKVSGSWVRDTLATGYCSYCSAYFIGGADPFGRFRGAFYDGASALKWAEFDGATWVLQDIGYSGGIESTSWDAGGRPYLIQDETASSAGSKIRLLY